jgi:hypothetical protein
MSQPFNFCLQVSVSGLAYHHRSAAQFADPKAGKRVGAQFLDSAVTLSIPFPFLP